MLRDVVPISSTMGGTVTSFLPEIRKGLAWRLILWCGNQNAGEKWASIAWNEFEITLRKPAPVAWLRLRSRRERRLDGFPETVAVDRDRARRCSICLFCLCPSAILRQYFSTRRDPAARGHHRQPLEI